MAGVSVGDSVNGVQCSDKSHLRARQLIHGASGGRMASLCAHISAIELANSTPHTTCSGALIPGAGRLVKPMRYSSTARAAPRPSLIAQTTRLWPRRQSPAAKTPSTLVANLPCSAAKVCPAAAGFDGRQAEHLADGQLGADEAGGQQHEVGGPVFLAAWRLR